MLIGRLVGWALIGVAVIMASVDAVMALGPADYSGIVTSEVLILLTGGDPAMHDTSWLARLQTMILELPAWVAVGGVGTAMLVACRKRQRQRRFRSRRA